MHTAGEPAKLRLTPDREVIRPGAEDLSYVLVEALDAKGGRTFPASHERRAVHLARTASIAGVANGDHHFPAEYVADHVALFYGKAVVVLRSAEGEGDASHWSKHGTAAPRHRVNRRAATKLPSGRSAALAPGWAGW